MPVLQSILLAERVYIDTQSDRKVLAGTFHDLVLERIPGLFDTGAYLYLAVREIKGTCILQVEFVDCGANKTLLEFDPIPIHAVGSLETIDIVIALPPLSIPDAGLYSFDIFSDNHFLGAFRLTVSAEPVEPAPPIRPKAEPLLPRKERNTTID